MKYVVKMNKSYMNSFKTYTDACVFRDMLERKYPTATVEIMDYEDWKEEVGE